MKKLIVVLVALLVVVSGCSFQNEPKMVEEEVANLKQAEETKAEAHRVISKAREEFYHGLSSFADMDLNKSVYEIPLEDWPLKEKIIGYAFEAYNTGDETRLVNLLKEEGLYQKYQKISNKYNLAEQHRILRSSDTASVQSVTESFFDSYYDGDIFLCYGGGDGSSSSSGSGFGDLIPGIWKHSGFMDTDASDPSAPILSASDKTTSGFCVGYETKTKWAGEASVSVWRVSGRTAAKARAAVDYSRNYIGKPYNIFSTRKGDDQWYCSKVVWRGWLSQGIDIEPSPWFTDPWVTPTDLAEDSDTYWIGGDTQ